MDSSTALQAARSALTRRDFRDVIRLTQGLVADPDPLVRVRALRLNGEAALELGFIPVALQNIQAALALAPDHGETWYVAGRLFEAAGAAGEAQSAWTRATKRTPALAAAWLALAAHHAANGRLPRAAEILQEGVQRNPTRADMTLQLLELLHTLGVLRYLNKAVASALQRFPRHAAIRLAAARARYLSGKIPEAMGQLDIALSIDPGDTSARALRAEYRMRSQDQAGALADVSHVLARQPGDLHPDAYLRGVHRRHVALDPGAPIWSSAASWSRDVPPTWPGTTTLKGTARLYRTTMALWLRARQLPGLRFTELRYETIVADIEAGARALVDAADLPWHDDVLDYRSQLVHQSVRTPSFAAITKPVTTRRIGRWLHFRNAMSPILPMLDPFVSELGYPASATLLSSHPSQPDPAALT